MQPLVRILDGVDVVDFTHYLELIKLNTKQQDEIYKLQKALRDINSVACTSFCEPRIHSSLCDAITYLLDRKKIKT